MNSRIRFNSGNRCGSGIRFSSGIRFGSGIRFSSVSLLASVAALSLLPLSFVQAAPSRGNGQSGGNAHSEEVAGELLVGVRADKDDAGLDQRLDDAVGSHKAYLRHLHIHQLKLRPGLSMAVAIARLKAQGEVTYIEPNHIVHATATPNDSFYSSQQYAPQITSANLAWSIWTPQTPVTIAIVDSGVDSTHPDLTNKILRDSQGIVGYDAFSGLRSDAMDGYGHGTHVAGIAAAQVNNGTGIAGIAGWDGSSGGTDSYYVQVMPVKVLDSTGNGTDATVAAGVQWAADHGAKIINLSLGGTSMSATTSNAIAYAFNKGCVIVAAAGNSSTNAYFYPAAYQNVISVAATTSTDTIASYSNYGSWVKVAAPGDMIYSTVPTYSVTMNGQYNMPLDYAYMNGTSMASPHVAGEAALLMAQNPSLTNTQVNNLITANVDAYTPYNGETIAAGAGRINIYRALQAAGAPAPAPTAPLAPSGVAATAGNAVVSLNWASSAGATSYNVLRSTVSGSLYLTIASGVTNTSYTDSSATNGMTYYYVVQAANSIGTSPNSVQVSATPSAPVVVPNAPTGLIASAGNTGARLTWTASAGATSYTVLRSTVNGSSYATVASGVTTTSYSDSGLKNGTTYYYVVRAVNSAGTSGNSNQASVKPTASSSAPAAPTSASAAGHSGYVSLGWVQSTSANIVQNRIYRAVGSGSFKFLGTINAGTSYTDFSVSHATSYSYKVTAVDASGLASGYSNITTTATP